MKLIAMILGVALLGSASYVFFNQKKVDKKAEQSLMSVQLNIQGMTCDHCARSITAVLEKRFEAMNVKVDVKSGNLSFSTSTHVDEAHIKEAVEPLGYEVAKFALK